MRARWVALAGTLIACAARPLDLPLTLPSAASDLGAAADFAGRDLGGGDFGGRDLGGDAGGRDLGRADLATPPDLARPAAVRLIAPMSTSMVTSHRPTLRFSVEPGATDLAIDLCADRACSRTIGHATVDAAGASARPDAPLPPGVVFWRARASLAGDDANSATWELFVGARDSAVDTAQGSVFDFNGDGRPDVAVDETALQPVGGVSPRVCHLYFGAAAGLDFAHPVTLPLAPSTSAYGNLANGGDLDGDGYGDLIASTYVFDPLARNGDFDGGTLQIWFGGPDGLDPGRTLVVTSPANPDLWFTGAGGAGDLDGDGYGDLWATASGGIYADQPRVLLFSGDPRRALDRRASLDFTNAVGGPLSVAGGDIDGDGLSDLVVGDPRAASTADEPYTPGGLVQFFLGTKSGLSAPVTLQPSPVPSPSRFYDEFGWSVALADLDGDGRRDVIVGGQDFAGTVYVYSSLAGGVSAVPTTTFRGAATEYMLTLVNAGDVDGDGADDLLIGGTRSGSIFATVLQYRAGQAGALTMSYPTAGSFGLALAGAGDLDGDGYGDVFIGAPLDAQGYAFLYTGSANGLPMTPAHTLTGTGADSHFGASFAGQF